MAVNNNSSEEDYLDNLLKAVLGGSDGQKDKKQNTDSESEEGFPSDDDLFAEALENADNELSDEEIKNLRFDDEPESAEEKTSGKEKKKKWGFMRKKSDDTEKSPSDVSQYIPNEALEEEEFEESLIDGAFENVLNETDEDSGDNEQSAETEEYTAESLEDDMQGLYDIFGVEEEESETAAGEGLSDELERLEEVKTSKRKKKKEKKKKKSKDEVPEEAEEEAPAIELVSVGNVDMTAGELEDIFLSNGEEGGFGEEIREEIPDENTRLIEDMDNGEFDESDILGGEDESEGKKKKEKKKKEKKEKKPKKEKPKKEKKKKEPKPKKPKQPDEIIPISKRGLVLGLSVIILIVLALILGGSYRNYHDRTNAAQSYYLNQDYEAAYEELMGLDIHEDDRFFYDKIETIMFVQRHYTSYKSLYEIELYDRALHTLLRGVKMYDKYKEQARELDCYEDLTTVLGWIDKALLDNYGITESQARELNQIQNRYEYGRRVYELADRVRVSKEEGSENDSDN